jgi:hypothetical protein
MKRTRDANQFGEPIVDIATRQVPNEGPARLYPETEHKDPAAVSLGHRSGLKKGRAKADRLTSRLWEIEDVAGLFQ